MSWHATPMNDRSKKYLPRRLFSFDSLRSGRTPSQYSQDVHTSVYSQVDEPVDEDPFGDDAKTARQEIRLDDGDDVHKQSGHSKPPTPASTAALPDQQSRSSTPDSLSSTTSSSRARWDKIRQHVLFSSANARQGSPQPQHTPSVFSPPPRSTTPKPSRFPRLGFRPVVEQVKEDTRIFSNEVRRACWMSRYLERFKLKGERDNFAATMNSSLYLPFMSSASLSGASGVPIGISRRQDTMMSRSSVPSPTTPTNQRTGPTLKPLWQLLMTYATPSPDGTLRCPDLPHETLVLSVLQGPFLKQDQSQGGTPDERRLAMESFEIIFRTWFPDNESSFVNYFLWCCNAAMIPPGGLRLRALNGLHGLLGSRDTKLISTPTSFLSLATGLLYLLSVSITNPIFSQDADALRTIHSCLNLLHSGACVAFDPKWLNEQYGVTFSEDGATDIYDLLALESVAKCLEITRGSSRAWLIQYACNDGWVPLRKERESSQLSALLHAEKLSSLSRAAAYILSPHGTDPSENDVHLLLQLVDAKLLPEISFLREQKAAEVMQGVGRVVLHAVILDQYNSLKQWAASKIHEWYRGSTDWKQAFELVLRDMLNDESWDTIMKALKSLFYLIHDPSRQSLFSFVLPQLNQRIAQDPPHPAADLSNVLSQLSHQYPPIFYKPLFSCAASSKEFIVMDQLCTLTAIGKYVPDYWIRDAEMISVALVSDISKADVQQKAPTFKSAKLGQMIILIELICQVQVARHKKEELSQTDSAFLDFAKFLFSLESRLSVLLNARENVHLYPISTRALYCILFREIRLFTRSSKPAPWLPKIVTWFIAYFDEELVSDAEYEELEDTFTRLQALYETARHGIQSPGNQRRTTTFLSARDMSDDQQKYDVFEPLSRGLLILKSARKGFVTKAMKLLVLMSTFLTTEDFVRLGPVVWKSGLDENEPSTLKSAAYLAMQCADKTPQDFLASIEVDAQSSDNLTRLKALRKLSILCNSRFDLASQPVITDRNRRALKLARGPLPFVPTDMGSSSYIFEDDQQQGQSTIPPELRKRLAEIGWTEEGTLEDQRREWLYTPMSLIPSLHLSRSRLEVSETLLLASGNTSPMLSPPISPIFPSSEKFGDQPLLRRNSSSGGPLYSAKRKAVFVPSLAVVFPRIATLAFDANIAVASAARTVIFDLMRNDPSLLSRPILDLLSDEENDIDTAMTSLNLLLRVHKAVPPSMAHHMFNHLAGYLKVAARQTDGYGLVDDFARTIPLLADLVPHVCGMSIRELRRSKLELYFVPTGPLWFSKPTPNEQMFPSGPVTPITPRSLSASVPPSLVSIGLIRVSQYLLFASMLRKNQQDVQFIRKHFSQLELPSLQEKPRSLNLDLRDFLPMDVRDEKPKTNDTIHTLSTMLSQSYLLLVAQIIPSMSRHLSDRSELALFIDGLNRILLVHGNDFGIVGQALIILMAASTRFRRLFVSGGVFMLFMPAVLKVYAESDGHSGIRLAIEYASGRFYAQYKDAFIFQSLDVISRLAAYPAINKEIFGKSVFDLFGSLRHGISPSTPDAAGIHDINKKQEREALLINTAEEKPQTFLAAIKHSKPDDGGPIAFDLPEEYQAPRLRITDFIKLFLTIIAHDIASLRAENFLKLFRLVAPHVFQASTAGRQTLQEGLDALGAILAKSPTKGRSAGAEPDDSLLGEQGIEQPSETHRSKSDIASMRLDYLSLIVSFSRAGGIVMQSTVYWIFEMAKGMLKESNNFNDRISVFLSDFTEATFLREIPPDIKRDVAYLRDLAQFIRAHGASLDLARTFAALEKLSALPAYSSNSMYAQVLNSQICSAGLAACSGAGRYISLPHSSSLVELLSRAIDICGSDVMTELEKQTPTYDYLAGIIFPLIMTLKTETHAPATNRSGSRYGPVWTRLLQYTLSACQNNQRLLNSESSDRKSMDRRRSIESTRASFSVEVPTFVITLQMIKAILVRATNDLSAHLPGVWNRMGIFFKSMLEGGNAEFALWPSEQSFPSSPVVSPFVTPRSSLQLDPFTRTDYQSFPNRQHGYLSPRVVDYAMWSLFELLCSYRFPLLLQIRHFIVEKVLDLDQALQTRWYSFPSNPIPGTPRSRPVSASAFSKPYRRASAAPSLPSPHLTQGRDSVQYSTYLSVSDNRKPDNHYHSASPTSQEAEVNPRIVHLGPTSLQPIMSPGGIGGVTLATKATKINSSSLIRATYRRIRVVQTYMGYRHLLPLPDEGMDDDKDNVELSSWTKYEALNAIRNETNELIAEFGELVQDHVHEKIIVEQSLN